MDTLTGGLDPFGRWMVRSNLERIAAGEVPAAELVAVVRANGYGRVADAIAAELERAAAATGEPCSRCGGSGSDNSRPWDADHAPAPCPRCDASGREPLEPWAPGDGLEGAGGGDAGA